MKIGFIGCGNMANAMIGGLISKGTFQVDEVIASDGNEGALSRAKDKYNITTTTDNKEVVKASDIVILSIKPMYYEEVIKEINSIARKEQIIISIAPGKTLRWIAEQFGSSEYKLVRTMPNTPALVGEGITGITSSETLTDEDIEIVLKIFNSFDECSGFCKRKFTGVCIYVY